MATRKNRPVLYEVVRRTRGVVVPAWLRKQGAPQPASAQPAVTQVPLPTPSGARSWPVRVGQGRVHFELAWPWLVVGGVALVVAFWLVFQVGLRVGRERAPQSYGSEFEAELERPARVAGVAAEPTGGVELRADHRPGGDQPVATPAAPAVRPSAAPPAGREPTGASAGFSFRAGYYYLVVQHFRKSQMEVAQKAGAFLNDHGIPCVIESGVDLRVIATEAFDLDQKDAKARDAEHQRLEALRSRIRALGREFARQYGYAFEQCYPQLRTK